LPGARRLGQWLLSSRLTRPLWRRLFFTQAVPHDYLDRFFDEYRRCSVFGDMFDLITADWFRSLQPIHRPAVLLWGERERVLSSDQAEMFHALVPGARTRTIAHWDHFPMIEQPDEYAREVFRLVEQLVYIDSDGSAQRASAS
ncbi:MAG: alpha/beta hydrolase, partial [Myxococcota bacterium]